MAKIHLKPRSVQVPEDWRSPKYQLNQEVQFCRGEGPLTSTIMTGRIVGLEYFPENDISVALRNTKAGWYYSIAVPGGSRWYCNEARIWLEDSQTVMHSLPLSRIT